MKYNILKEAEIPTVAIIFGRFNPPHKGHKGAWEVAAKYDHWYVGTNPNTQGAKGKSGKAGENKDPLPYELKVAAMEAIMPSIKGHIVPENTWWSLATMVYDKHGKVNLVIVSDPEDGAGFVKGLLNSNGKEGRHGYYNFANIEHAAAPRASSATALRAAVANDDRDAFAQAAGVDPDLKIQGRPYFDLVSHYLVGKEMKESSLGKIVRESKATTLADLDVDEGDKIEFYYSKYTPRMPATVTGFEDGKVVVTIDNGREFRLNWTHEAVLAETVNEELVTYLNDKGNKVTGRVAKRSTNSPKGYFLDTGEFVSQRRVIAKESLGEEQVDEDWRDQLKAQKEKYAKAKERSPNVKIHSKPSPNTARRRDKTNEAEGSSYRFYVPQEQWNEAAKQMRLMKYADYTATKTSEGYIELVFANKDEAYDAVVGLETGDIEVLDADERIFQESKKKKMPQPYRELITYLNDKGKKVTGRVAKRSTNSPKGYFLDTGEFVSQQRVIAKESLGEAEGWVTGAKLVKKGGQLGLKFPKIGTVFGVGEMITYGDEDGYITGFSKNGTKVQVEIDREHGTKKYWWPIDGVEQHWDNRRIGEDSDPMNPRVGNYDLQTLQKKVARDFADAAKAMSTANSKREWINAIYQIENNTMHQVEDIIDAYEALNGQRKRGGINSRGIDANRVESKSMLSRVVNETQEGYIEVGGDRYDGGLYVVVHHPDGQVEELEPIDGEEPVNYNGKVYDGVGQMAKALGYRIQAMEGLNEEDLEEGVNDPHIFKAIFLAGGPGSGKSFVSNKLLSHTGLKVVNSDDIYEYLMKKADLKMDPETIFSPQGQEIRNNKAKPLTKARQSMYMKGGLGLIIDGTGKDVAKVQKQMNALKESGYDCMMLFVNTSLDVAQERNQMRERSLDPKQVEKMWREVQDNIMKFQQLFGAANFVVVDNSGGLEDPTRAAEFQKVWKHIDKFVNSPAQSWIAKKWIEVQKGQK